ncbi:SHOCT domain-containing protein [Diaminobutyricibacter sp. McL0618]|uniref:SHOCT domain-containing protein n=1 Tax=Leifsonia sp. McL0618 TaxID=3415677 RepID=UPI003CF86C71
MSFWDFLWFFFWTYIFISFIIILFQMFADLFRDRSLNGWAKALWIIFLVFIPFLGALIYLVVRGRGMAERQAARMMVAQADNDAYIRTVASSSSPSATDDIAKAKALLDSGAITQAEYDALKARAIG